MKRSDLVLKLRCTAPCPLSFTLLAYWAFKTKLHLRRNFFFGNFLKYILFYHPVYFLAKHIIKSLKSEQIPWDSTLAGKSKLPPANKSKEFS